MPNANAPRDVIAELAEDGKWVVSIESGAVVMTDTTGKNPPVHVDPRAPRTSSRATRALQPARQ